MKLHELIGVDRLKVTAEKFGLRTKSTWVNILKMKKKDYFQIRFGKKITLGKGLGAWEKL